MHVSESLGRVEDAQLAVNTALDLYGENSVVYLDAVDNLEKLEAAADKAKGNETAGLIGMGLTAVGVAAQVGTLAAKLKLIDELALAGGIVIPIALAMAAINAMKQTDYYEEGDPTLPPGPANAPGFRLDRLIQDWIGGGYEGVMGGTGRTMGGPQGVTITQINYGVEGESDSLDALQAAIDRMFNTGDE